MNALTNRREFLGRVSQSAAVLGAATTLGGVHLFADQKPERIRLGIIGCGGIMTQHVKGLVERREAVSLAWLCDVDPAQVDRIDKLVIRDFQAAPAKRTARYEDVIEDEDGNYRWMMVIEAVDPLFGSSEDEPLEDISDDYELYQITVQVAWGEFDPPKSIVLRSLRVMERF